MNDPMKKAGETNYTYAHIAAVTALITSLVLGFVLAGPGASLLAILGNSLFPGIISGCLVAMFYIFAPTYGDPFSK